MKEMNRREFLALSGASVALLALAACGSTPSTPAAPAGSKEAELVAAINKVWKEKHDAGAVVHEQLTLNQDAVGAIRCYGRVFEEANETPHTLKDIDLLLKQLPKCRAIVTTGQKATDTLRQQIHVSPPSHPDSSAPCPVLSISS